MRIRLQIKLQNDHLLQAMRENGMKTGADLHRASGIDKNSICHYISLKDYPRTEKRIARLEETLKRPFDMLFPEDLRAQVERNPRTTFYFAKEVKRLPFEDVPTEKLLVYDHQVQDAIDGEDLRSRIDKAFTTLTQREEKTLRVRFGIGGETPRTLEETADIFKVSKERIRQIEGKALRKLRHPERSKMFGDHQEGRTLGSWWKPLHEIKENILSTKAYIKHREKMLKEVDADYHKYTDVPHVWKYEYTPARWRRRCISNNRSETKKAKAKLKTLYKKKHEAEETEKFSRIYREFESNRKMLMD